MVRDAQLCCAPHHEEEQAALSNQPAYITDLILKERPLGASRRMASSTTKEFLMQQEQAMRIALDLTVDVQN
jgi:transposase